MQVSSIALGLLAVCVSMNALASVVLAARLYTRFHILRNAAWEDLAISIAWVSNLLEALEALANEDLKGILARPTRPGGAR